MRYQVLATDYDGTLAHDGSVDRRAVEALLRLRDSGRRLIMITGRLLPDLLRVFEQIELFDCVIAENGGLLYEPADRVERALAEPPPAELVEALRARDVVPLSVGRVIVATLEPHIDTVRDALREQGIERQLILNKGAVMLLPPGIDKASGLAAALARLGLPPHSAVGIGDAENDFAFLSICGCAVAVANALPALKQRVTLVTRGAHGDGVIELIDALLKNDLLGMNHQDTKDTKDS
jgi:HAD superfamily hydrolase (TIGR01484 family)